MPAGTRGASSLNWVEKGSEVEIEWKVGLWHPATVLEVEGRGDERRFYMRWHDFTKKYDEWLCDHTRIRKPLGAAQRELERVLKKYGTTEGAAPGSSTARSSTT